MNRIRHLNSWSDANPGKTLLAIFTAFALACCILPADPPSVASQIQGVSK